MSLPWEEVLLSGFPLQGELPPAHLPPWECEEEEEKEEEEEPRDRG